MNNNVWLVKIIRLVSRNTRSWSALAVTFSTETRREICWRILSCRWISMARWRSSLWWWPWLWWWKRLWPFLPRFNDKFTDRWWWWLIFLPRFADIVVEEANTKQIHKCRNTQIFKYTNIQIQMSMTMTFSGKAFADILVKAGRPALHSRNIYFPNYLNTAVIGECWIGLYDDAFNDDDLILLKSFVFSVSPRSSGRSRQRRDQMLRGQVQRQKFRRMTSLSLSDRSMFKSCEKVS